MKMKVHVYHLNFVLVNRALNKAKKILRLTISCKMASLQALKTLTLYTQLHISVVDSQKRSLVHK